MSYYSLRRGNVVFVISKEVKIKVLFDLKGGIYGKFIKIPRRISIKI